ncbi:MAG: hypothetical protein WCT29_01765 [Candidatus Paceibacterota bacterium]|jgi:hypothetical protein
MKNKNLIRFVQSLVLLPVITTSFSMGSVQKTETATNLLAKINIETDGAPALNQAAATEVLTKEARARAVDAYFKERDMPLAGTGMAMVTEAEKNGLDWRLVAAIAVRESTGGKFACKRVDNNPFGWGSCKIGFKSNEHAIATIARNLGGNNPNTAYHYEDKDTKAILQAYNPPSIVPRYADQVIAIMNSIGPINLGTMNSLAQS